jgi:WD40 repeat protein
MNDQQRMTWLHFALLLIFASAPAALAGPLPAGALGRFGSDHFRVPGLPGSPMASALSADGSRLAVLWCASGKQVVLDMFDTVDGAPVSRGVVESPSHFHPQGLAFSPDGTYVAAAISKEVRPVWVASSGELVRNLATPKEQSWFALTQFTPDGLLVVTGETKTELHDIPSGRLVKTWPIGRIARLTADGKTFMRVEKKGDAKNQFANVVYHAISIGDTATGAMAGALCVKIPPDSVGDGLPAFSPDGKRLAVIQYSNKIELWDVATRKRVVDADLPDRAILNEARPYYAVSFAPDGRTISLQNGRSIHRWDAASLKPLPQLDNLMPGDCVRGVHWSKDRQTILAVTSDSLIHRWDAKTGKRFPDEAYHNPVCFAVTPDESQLIVGDASGRIDVWDVATRRLVRQLNKGNGHGYYPLAFLAISPDGSRVAAGGQQLTAEEDHDNIRLYRMDGAGDARQLRWPGQRDDGWLHYLTWAPDGQSLFAYGSARYGRNTVEFTLARVRAADGKVMWAERDRDENVSSVALTPDGRFVVKTFVDGIRFLDAATGKETSRVRLNLTQNAVWDRLRGVTIARDGKLLALVAGIDTIVICDAAGQEIRRFDALDKDEKDAIEKVRKQFFASGGVVHGLAFSPDSKWLVSGAEDVRVWEIASGKRVARFESHDKSVGQLLVAGDGKAMFATADGVVYQWDLTPKRRAGPKPNLVDLWTAASSSDPAIGVPAAWELVSQSDASRAFIAEKLPPSAGLEEQETQKLLNQLDSEGYTKREAASMALARLGRIVEPRLKELAQTTKSLEARRRAEQLLERLRTHSPEELRELRLVQACELCGTTATRALLQRWAGGAPEAPLASDAKAAVARGAGRR